MYAMSEVRAPVQEAIRAAEGAPHFLVHNEGDQVAVAVQDVPPGPARAVFMDSDRSVEVHAAEDIPLGHKVALARLREGGDVIEYGVTIGIARTTIEPGSLVHVHNLRSARWERGR